MKVVVLNRERVNLSVEFVVHALRDWGHIVRWWGEGDPDERMGRARYMEACLEILDCEVVVVVGRAGMDTRMLMGVALAMARVVIQLASIGDEGSAFGGMVEEVGTRALLEETLDAIAEDLTAARAGGAAEEGVEKGMRKAGEGGGKKDGPGT